MNQTIHQICDALEITGENSNLYELVLKIAKNIFGGDHGILLELEATTGNLREVASFGKIDDMLNQDIRSFAQFATNHPDDKDSIILTLDARKHKKLSTKKSIRRDMAAEVIILPLVSKNRPIGALYIGSSIKGSLNEEAIDISDVMKTGTLLGNIISIDRSFNRLSQKNKALQQKLLHETPFNYLIGTGRIINQIKNSLELVTSTELPVTLIGRRGAGKNQIAKYIHENSERKDGPFVTLNLDSIPEKILATILFGQMRGPRRKESNGRIGVLREANGGTLFIENIEKLPLYIQARFIQVLTMKELIPLNGKKQWDADFRLIVSTDKDLKSFYENQELRTDFYMKLCEYQVIVPNLNERVEDLPLLIEHFVENAAANYGKTITGISTDVFDYMSLYDWPGNLLELESEIRQAVLRTPNRGLLTTASISKRLLSKHQPVLEVPEEGTLKQRISTIEKKMIIDALEMNRHNQSMTSEMLGLSRQALINKLQRYGIETGRKYKKQLREIAERAANNE